jgi:hypothetical protein
MSRQYTKHVPTIALFFGIVISMRFDDHPPPHFHAKYGDDQASYTLDGELLVGHLPNKQDKLVREWAQSHSRELDAAWEACSHNRNPGKID